MSINTFHKTVIIGHPNIMNQSDKCKIIIVDKHPRFVCVKNDYNSEIGNKLDKLLNSLDLKNIIKLLQVRHKKLKSLQIQKDIEALESIFKVMLPIIKDRLKKNTKWINQWQDINPYFISMDINNFKIKFSQKQHINKDNTKEINS
jgi:hypothetical protein